MGSATATNEWQLTTISDTYAENRQAERESGFDGIISKTGKGEILFFFDPTLAKFDCLIRS